jgi:hypothetical protein
MPTIAIVDGVKIQMFYDDHTPPHFHAIISGNKRPGSADSDPES